MADPEQTVVLRLPAELVRRGRSFADAHADAYGSFSELVGAALANQLELEAEGHAGPSGEGGGSGLLGRRLLPPDLAEPPEVDRGPLFVLTNRLFPLKVSCRVLANLQSSGAVPAGEFQAAAARAARLLGLRLRDEDARAGRRGPDRRWIALPVGDDEHAALARYAQFFALGISGSGSPTGPLPQLSLATAVGDGGECRLTQLGWDVAEAANPVLDGDEAEPLLDSTERRLFIEALRTNPAETEAIAEFRGAVEGAAGIQSEVDAAIQRAHEGWNRERAAAQRAAMVGRLHDLGLASVDGRGPAAAISLDEGVDELTGGGR